MLIFKTEINKGVQVVRWGRWGEQAKAKRREGGSGAASSPKHLIRCQLLGRSKWPRQRRRRGARSAEPRAQSPEQGVREQGGEQLSRLARGGLSELA